MRIIDFNNNISHTSGTAGKSGLASFKQSYFIALFVECISNACTKKKRAHESRPAGSTSLYGIDSDLF